MVPIWSIWEQSSTRYMRQEKKGGRRSTENARNTNKARFSKRHKEHPKNYYVPNQKDLSGPGLAH